MNPILPDKCFVPDCEARVMPDGRLYLYGSWDIAGSGDYCSRELHCFSTDDLEHFTDHGVIFRNDEQFCGIPWSPACQLYAPDAIHKDGKYYLYVCGSGREEGVAVSDSPKGPFPPAQRIALADGDGIDPTVFVDDDGSAYYFWGQVQLRGARLANDMKTILADSVIDHILTEWEHGFHEGASIRKRGDKYYMVYADIARGKPTCLSYAIAEKPLGPYRKAGTIIDNIYCDPASWNNHGSIAQFQGKWYVFYHRSSQKKNTCRRVCAEPIEFDENGFIKEVEQTSQGVSYALAADAVIPARTACRMMGSCHVVLRDEREVLLSDSKGHFGSADWAEYKYLDFGSGGLAVFHAKVRGKGRLTVKAEGGEVLCALSFETAAFEDLCASAKSLAGIHVLWLFVEGEFELESFYFA